MSNMSEAIKLIEEKSPGVLDPGATSEYLESVLCELPYKLPQEVCELYLRADGLVDYVLFWAGRFFCLSDSVNIYKKLRECKNFDASWFPIMENEGWIYFIVGSHQQQEASQVYKIDGGDLMSTYDVEPYLEYASLVEMILASIAALDE
jgi:cell wall assembly regulator SMI1